MSTFAFSGNLIASACVKEMYWRNVIWSTLTSWLCSVSSVMMTASSCSRRSLCVRADDNATSTTTTTTKCLWVDSSTNCGVILLARMDSLMYMPTYSMHMVDQKLVHLKRHNQYAFSVNWKSVKMASLIYFDFRSLQKTYKSIDTFHRCEQLGKAVSLLGHPCNVTTFRKIRNHIVRHTPLSTITYAHIIMGFFLLSDVGIYRIRRKCFPYVFTRFVYCVLWQFTDTAETKKNYYVQTKIRLIYACCEFDWLVPEYYFNWVKLADAKFYCHVHLIAYFTVYRFFLPKVYRWKPTVNDSVAI